MSLKINQLLADNSNFSVGQTAKPKYIVIHYTGNNGDTAKGNASYFSNNPDIGASANYFVDETEAYISVLEEDTAWHCGTSGSYIHPICRNYNSLGIELCSRRDEYGNYFFHPETISNAVELVKILMSKYNIKADNVLRHYDVTGKNCPAPFVQDEAQWLAFKERLIEKEDDLMTQDAFNILIATWQDLNDPFYKILEDVPSYWKDEAAALVAAGAIKGDGTYSFGIRQSVLKAAIINKRYVDSLKR